MIDPDYAQLNPPDEFIPCRGCGKSHFIGDLMDLKNELCQSCFVERYARMERALEQFADSINWSSRPCLINGYTTNDREHIWSLRGYPSNLAIDALQISRKEGSSRDN